MSLLFFFLFLVHILIDDNLNDDDTIANEGDDHAHQTKTVSFWILHIQHSCSKQPDQITSSIHNSCKL